MGIRKQVEHDFAKQLYVNEYLTQKEVSERVGVPEKTISKWRDKGNWDTLRTSMFVTKDVQLKKLYAQLDSIQKDIETRPIVRDIPTFLLKPIKVKDSDGNESLDYPEYKAEDYPIKIGNFPNSADTDAISKVVAAIKKLETETNVGEVIQVCKGLIQFIQAIDQQMAKTLTSYCDAFIKEKLK
ncbi:MAG: hypothetical protein JST78_09600 [Bacteroidetes bacterium]|nr:hypothetical protein [Bacteroidota bacterium]